MSRLPGPDADTVLAGVIGSPVRHSLSPLLHNAAFDALGLNWVSLAFEVPAGAAAGALEGVRALGLGGLSVTMPHKAEVAALVDRRTGGAERLGAVNSIRLVGDELWGANTDGEGFVTSLRRGAGFDPAGRRALVVGAGGAARAVILALAEAGAAAVAVLNRTAVRAEEAAALAGAAGHVVGSAPGELEETVARADLVVQATPVGMEGVAGADAGRGDLPGLAGLLGPGQVAADLVYVPRPTPWLRAAAAAGATVVDGLGMLVHQAAVQIEWWTGLEAPVEAMWRAASSAP